MSTAPAVTMQDLEFEHAELLPARETLFFFSYVKQVSAFNGNYNGNFNGNGILNVASGNLNGNGNGTTIQWA
jgi:hypothetical protein